MLNPWSWLQNPLFDAALLTTITTGHVTGPHAKIVHDFVSEYVKAEGDVEGGISYAFAHNMPVPFRQDLVARSDSGPLSQDSSPGPLSQASWGRLQPPPQAF
jgi:hypothetical protein